MSDVGEPNLYALAQDVKHLSSAVDEMSAKADRRWDTQQKILVEIANNKTEMKNLMRRINGVEELCESLNAWRWKTVGVVGVVVLLVEVIMKV